MDIIAKKYKKGYLIEKAGRVLAIVKPDKTIQFMFYTNDNERNIVERIVWGD